MLLTTVGAFAAFSLMAIAIGTDYWLYSSAHICNGTNITADEAQGPPRKARGDLTHSGLWRICCLEGTGEPRRDRGGKQLPGGSGCARSPRAELLRSRAAVSDTAEEEDGVTVATGISEIAMGTGGGMRSSARGSCAFGATPPHCIPYPWVAGIWGDCTQCWGSGGF